MKKILLCTFVLLLFNSSFLQSQTKPKGRENSLKAGNWALMFGIDQNFKLTSLNGFTLSIKKHMSDNHALRLGLSVNYDNEDGTNNLAKDTNISESDRTGNSYSIALYPSYYIYIAPKADVNFYVGLGLFGKYSKSKSDYVHYYNHRTENYEDESTGSESIGYGINTNLGVEFFPIKSFSIFAEYSLSFGYSKTQSNDDTTYYFSEGTSTSHSLSVDKKFSLINDGVVFGLCVYF